MRRQRSLQKGRQGEAAVQRTDAPQWGQSTWMLVMTRLGLRL
jgi:hypothetical protein